MNLIQNTFRSLLIDQIVQTLDQGNFDDEKGVLVSGDDRFSIPEPSRGAQMNTEALARHQSLDWTSPTQVFSNLARTLRDLCHMSHVSHVTGHMT